MERVQPGGRLLVGMALLSAVAIALLLLTHWQSRVSASRCSRSLDMGRLDRPFSRDRSLNLSLMHGIKPQGVVDLSCR